MQYREILLNTQKVSFLKGIGATKLTFDTQYAII